jgi:hypothetical protein
MPRIRPVPVMSGCTPSPHHLCGKVFDREDLSPDFLIRVNVKSPARRPDFTLFPVLILSGVSRLLG